MHRASFIETILVSLNDSSLIMFVNNVEFCRSYLLLTVSFPSDKYFKSERSVDTLKCSYLYLYYLFSFLSFMYSTLSKILYSTAYILRSKHLVYYLTQYVQRDVNLCKQRNTLPRWQYFSGYWVMFPGNDRSHKAECTVENFTNLGKVFPQRWHWLLTINIVQNMYFKICMEGGIWSLFLFS